MKVRKSEIVAAIADVERVMAAIPGQIEETSRVLFMLLDESEMSGTLSAVRRELEIEEDAEHVRAHKRALALKYRACERRLCDLREALREFEAREAAARAAAIAERRRAREKKARVSG